MKLAEWMIALGCLALSTLIFIDTFRLPRIAADPGGLALMPRVFALVTIIGVLLMFAGYLLRLSPAVEKDAGADQPGNEGEPTRNRQLIGVIVLTVLYPFVMLKLGFLLATGLYLAAVLTVLRARLLPAVALTAVSPIVLYFLFAGVLGAHLPSGQWLAALLD